MLIRRSWSKGFTLLEIVISLGLIATGLMAVFRLQAQNLDLQSEARFLSTAKHLAEDRVSQIAAGGGLKEGTSTGDFGDRFPEFSYREDVSELPHFKGLFKISVNISLDGEDLKNGLSVDTYLYRP
jgi:prepilin-type N-terminal cleavage/methylation domain-containing protein